MNNDPLSLVAETFERYLIASPGLRVAMRSVGIDRRIDGFLATRGTKRPDTHTESDLPRMELHWSGGPSNVNWTSGLAEFNLFADVQIITGDKRFNCDLFPVVFALFACVCAAKDDDDIMELVWPDDGSTDVCNFVNNISLSNVNVGFFSPSQSVDGIQGTMSICTLGLHLHFDQQLLAAYHYQT